MAALLTTHILLLSASLWLGCSSSDAEMHRLAKLEYACHPDHANDTPRALQWGYLRALKEAITPAEYTARKRDFQDKGEQDLENARSVLKDNAVVFAEFT